MTSSTTTERPTGGPEWVPDAWQLHTEGSGDGTGPWTLQRIADQRGMTRQGVSVAFQRAGLKGKPKKRTLPWSLPHRHRQSTTGRRLMLVARRAQGEELTPEEGRWADLFLQRIPPGMVISYDPDKFKGYGAFVYQAPTPGEELTAGIMSATPLRFDDED